MSWFWDKSRKEPVRRYLARPILDRNKAKFFVRLCQAVPTFYVFPQVALSALLAAAAGKHQKSNREKIAGTTVDYAVYNANLTLVCVVQLCDGGSHTDAIVQHCCKEAGIKAIRWDAESTPSVDQIRRIMLPSIDRAKATPDAANWDALESAATTEIVIDPPDPRRETPGGIMPTRQQPNLLLSSGAGLSAAKLEQLTPGKVLQTHYPHIWQRISVFAIEPKHLRKYLLSLSMQDRTEKRAGLALEALKEIADIQIQNDRFLMETGSSWQAGFVHP